MCFYVILIKFLLALFVYHWLFLWHPSKIIVSEPIVKVLATLLCLIQNQYVRHLVSSIYKQLINSIINMANYNANLNTNMQYPYPNSNMYPDGYNPPNINENYPQQPTYTPSQPGYPQTYVPPNYQQPYAPQNYVGQPVYVQSNYPPQTAIPMVIVGNSAPASDDLAWREHELKMREYDIKKREEQQDTNDATCCLCCACLAGCCLASMLDDH